MYRCNGRIIPPSESHKGINRVAATVEKAVVEEVRRVLSTDILHNLNRPVLEETSEAEITAVRREDDRLRHQLEEAGQDLAEVIRQYRKRKLDEIAYPAVKQVLERTMQGLQKRREEVKKRRGYLGGSALRLGRAREGGTRFRDLWEQNTTPATNRPTKPGMNTEVDLRSPVVIAGSLKRMPSHSRSGAATVAPTTSAAYSMIIRPLVGSKMRKLSCSAPAHFAPCHAGHSSSQKRRSSKSQATVEAASTRTSERMRPLRASWR